MDNNQNNTPPDEQDLSEDASSISIENQSIGDFLKEQREKKNESISSIASKTRIPIKLLELLEENKFDSLPSKVYVIGHIKIYAKMLGIDQTKALKIFHRSYDNTQYEDLETQSKDPLIKLESHFPENDIKNKKLYIIIFFSIFTIIFIIISLTISKKSPEVTEKIEISNDNQKETHVKKIKNKKIIKKVMIPKAAVTKVKEEEKKVLEEVIEKEKNDEEKQDTIFKRLRTPSYRLTEISLEEKKLIFPAENQSAQIEGKQNIFINAINGDTWITYKSDDDPIKAFVLQKGKTLLVRGDLIRLVMGNINAGKIILNGKLLGLRSISGVKSLVFPKEQASNYYHPLFIYPAKGQIITSEEYLRKNPKALIPK